MTQAVYICDVGPVKFDLGRHPRGKIGYVLLATEQTIQDDVMKLRPEGVGIHFARAAIPDSITSATLAAQADELATAASQILPDGTLDVVCYACTSGSIVIGEDEVFNRLRSGAPNAHATSLVTGVIEAARAMGASRLAVATPYLDEINRLEAAYLERLGFSIVNLVGLQLEKDSEMVRVAPDFIADFAASVDQADADAVFVSCGALRTLDVIDIIEQRIGKPAICSNQAMIWHTLRLLGVEDQVDGYGSLLRDF